MQHVIVAGSTGLVGREVVRQLAARSGKAAVAVHALTRRPVADLPTGVEGVVFDFADPRAYERIGTAELPCHVLLCCIGTTMRAAGSQAAFLKVDRDIPLRLVERLQALPARPVFGLISSVGADRPVGFYLRTKAEVEAAARASGLPWVIARPSLIIGPRADRRPGERIAMLLAPGVVGLASVLTGRRVAAVERYRPVAAATIAERLIRRAVDAPPARGADGVVLEGESFFSA